MKRKASKNYRVYFADGPLKGDSKYFMKRPKPTVTYTMSSYGRKYSVTYIHLYNAEPSPNGCDNSVYVFHSIGE